MTSVLQTKDTAVKLATSADFKTASFLETPKKFSTSLNHILVDMAKLDQGTGNGTG